MAYIGAEVRLSHVEVDLADIEVGLMKIGTGIINADELLSAVGAGTELPTRVRIPLPNVKVSLRGNGDTAKPRRRERLP